MTCSVYEHVIKCMLFLFKTISLTYQAPAVLVVIIFTHDRSVHPSVIKNKNTLQHVTWWVPKVSRLVSNLIIITFP